MWHRGTKFSIIFLEIFSFLVGFNNSTRCVFNTQQKVRSVRYFLTFRAGIPMLPEWRLCLGTKNSESSPSPASWSLLGKDDEQNRYGGSSSHWEEDRKRRWSGEGGVVTEWEGKKQSNQREDGERHPAPWPCEGPTYLEHQSVSLASFGSSLLSSEHAFIARFTSSGVPWQ